MGRKRFRYATLIGSALALAGCKTLPEAQQQAAVAQAAAAPGAPGCKPLGGGGSSNTTNAAIGAGVGALVGALVGRSAADKSSVGVRNGALFGALAGALAGSQYNKMIGMTEQADGSVKLNIPGQVLFPTGSAEISPGFRQTLDQVGATIREYCGLTATVTGHTDSTGTYATNARLSLARAESVSSYLRAVGVDGARLYSEGKASDVPIASNAEPAGRAQNRRVEIFVRPPAQ
jgi:outer membrane protein OmpA-like peptidoglycan-associated protein